MNSRRRSEFLYFVFEFCILLVKFCMLNSCSCLVVFKPEINQWLARVACPEMPLSSIHLNLILPKIVLRFSSTRRALIADPTIGLENRLPASPLKHMRNETLFLMYVLRHHKFRNRISHERRLQICSDSVCE